MKIQKTDMRQNLKKELHKYKKENLVTMRKSGVILYTLLVLPPSFEAPRDWFNNNWIRNPTFWVKLII